MPFKYQGHGVDNVHNIHSETPTTTDVASGVHTGLDHHEQNTCHRQNRNYTKGPGDTREMAAKGYETRTETDRDTTTATGRNVDTYRCSLCGRAGLLMFNNKLQSVVSDTLTNLFPSNDCITADFSQLVQVTAAGENYQRVKIHASCVQHSTNSNFDAEEQNLPDINDLEQEIKDQQVRRTVHLPQHPMFHG